MENFKKTKLIVAQEDVEQLDSFDELEKKIFGEKYKELSQKEKLQQRYEMALPLSIINKRPIVYSEKGIINKDKTFDTKTSYSLQKSIVIDDEKTFILSLCKIDSLRILERKDANIFLSQKDRETMKDKKANYVFINTRVDEIMKNYLQLKGKNEDQKIME